MDENGNVTDDERLQSAHKLFGIKAESTLSAIDSIPAPASQADPSTRNVEGVADPAKWVIPHVDVDPPGEAPPAPKGPAFLDQIPDANPAPQSQPGAAPAQPSFLADIPDASSPLHQAYQDASVFDATHTAIVRRLANQFGQPPEFIDKNIQQAKAQAAAPGPAFFDMMEKNYPGSTKFYSQPENMAVAHDDMPNVVQTEGIVNAATQSRSLWDLFEAGLEHSVAGDVVTGGKPAKVPDNLSSMETLALGAGQVIPDLLPMAVGGAVGAMTGAELGPLGAIFGGGAGAFGTPTALHEVLDAYRNGHIKTIGDAFSRFVAAEKKVGKQMLVGGASALTGYVAGPFGAIPALMAENAAMTVGGKVAEGELKNANDVMDYVTGDQVPRDLFDNLVLATGLHAAHAGADAIRGRISDAQTQRVNRQLYDNLGQAAADSKLRERLPDVHSEFVNGLAEGTPFKDIFLPLDAATAYFQGKGMDIEDVARNLGASDSLAEARATGSDLKIPLATWLEKMVGTEHFKALRDDVKFSPEDLSTRQSAEIQNETRARVQDAADEALKGAEIPAAADQDGKIEAAQKVYQNMQEKLSAVGLSGAEVKHNPMLFRDFFSSLADRINEGAEDGQKVDALELQQRFHLDVRSFESPEARDQAAQAERESMLKEARTGTRQEQIAMARRALESVPDLHKDDVADALGLSRMTVRALRGISERKGRGNYSKEEILRAAGTGGDMQEGHLGYAQDAAKYKKPEDITLDYDPHRSLEPYQRRVEESLGRQLSEPEAEKAYNEIPEARGGKVLDADLARRLSPEFSKDRQGATLHGQSTHQPAGQFIWEYFKKKLAEVPKGFVVLMAGGPGSGKSSTVEEYAGKVPGVEMVYDGTGQRLDDQIEKIEAAIASGRPVENVYVYTQLDQAALRAQGRFNLTGRPVPPDALTRAHVNSLENFLALAKKYEGNSDVTFKVYDNTGAGPVPRTVDELNKLRYTQDGETAEQAIKRLTPQVKEALNGQEAEVQKAHDLARTAEAVSGQSRSFFQSYAGRDEQGGSESESSPSAAEQGREGQLAPPFYSKLTRTVEEKMGGSATPEQISGMLREIKPEERKWLGVDDFLKGKEKVSKQELLDFLRGNAVEIKEVLKSDDQLSIARSLPSFQAVVDELVSRGDSKEEAEDYATQLARGKVGGASSPKAAEGLRNEYIEQHGYGVGGPKFGQYTLPGGENYREVLFQLPVAYPKFEDVASGKKPLADPYRSSHFAEENVLAHTRLNDRTDSEGKKALHIEEIQSDWHQAGRKKGYKGDGQKELAGYKVRFNWSEDGKSGSLARIFETKEEAQAALERSQKTRGEDAKDWKISEIMREPDESSKVPDAPFRKNWHEFVLKRLIREAAEKGYDKLTWTTGEQQAERYDLAKQVSNVIAKKNADGTFDVGAYKDGSTVAAEKNLKEPQLEAMLGKDLAKKILNEEGKVFPEERGGGRVYEGKDLKVGGEGMKGFYDKIIPEFLNKFGKKFGAKVGESEIDAGGAAKRYVTDFDDDSGDYRIFDTKDGEYFDTHYADQEAAEEAAYKENESYIREGVKVHSLEITPALKKAALEEGFSLFQGDKEGPRGQITFAGRDFNIDLFKEKDVSTFLHETGHYFLEVMGHVVEGEGAGSEGLQKDYATILKFLGVSSRDEITEDQHEKFARAFEQYLSEGKAPSEGLREAFSQFKSWLTGLWRKVSFQKVEVSPEIREVFDRMLSTEDQVKDARKSLDMDKEFNLDGVDDKTKGEIEKLRERARAKAEETLLRERLKETKSEYREQLAAERAKFQEAAEAQVREEPLFKAIDQLREQSGGKDPYETAAAALRGELSPEELTEFQMLADEHGFTTAEDMAQQIDQAGATNLFDTKVSDMVDEALRNVGAIKDPAALREEALKAVHSDDAEELMALERQALIDLAAKRVVSAEQRVQNRARAKLEMAAAKSEAEAILAKMPAEEAGRPQRFITQERNAAARVARFVAKRDFERASEAKQQQMVAHALVRESFRINEEADKHLKYIRSFMGRKGSLLDMPFGFVRQLDVLLDRFGFQSMPKEDENTLKTIAAGMAQEGESPHDIANATGYVEDDRGNLQAETLPQFIQRQNDNYHAMDFPPEVLGAVRRDSKDLTLSELRAVRETMQTIAEGGRKNNRFLNEFIKVDIKEAAKKFREKVESTFGTPYAEQLLPGKTEQGKLADLLDTLQHFPDALNRTLDTMLTTCHKFDGLEEGPAKEFIYRPMAEAEARKTTRMKESMAEMEGIFAKHYEEGEFAKYKDTEIAQNGRKYTKEQVLAMALNWGNGGNRQRLLSMPGLDEASVRQLFTHLGKKDWDFVQDTWDHIDKYWPEIKKLEMSVNGVEPAKVEGLKFKNEHGEYKGGYYPIAYDFEKSADAFQHNQTKDALFKQYSTAKAATSQGHAQARVARVTRPLRLSLDVLANHHEDIIHDLEFRRSVIDINRFLSERDTKAAITNAVGVRGYASMQDWLKSVAGGGSEPLTAWDRAAQWFRFRTTMYAMGFRMVKAPLIAAENIKNSAAEIGWSGTARAIKNYYLGDGSHELVVGKSPFMRERADHLDRDMSDLIAKQRGSGQSAFQKYAFFVHAYLDQGMSFPLWADSYRRAIADHGDERLAVHQADESVKRTFMTGNRVDQAGFARGSEVKKSMTIAYGYANMMWNRFSRDRFQASSEWNNGNHLQAAATMAMSTIYTLALPAMISALTSEFMRNGPQSSPEDRKKRMLENMLEEGSPLRFVPIARDIQAYGIRKAFGERTSDLQLAPLEGMMQALVNPLAEAAGGKHSSRFGEESAAGLSFALGVPKQVNDVAFNFLDWQHGHGAVTWRDALSRRHKK